MLFKDKKITLILLHGKVLKRKFSMLGLDVFISSYKLVSIHIQQIQLFKL